MMTIIGFMIVLSPAQLMIYVGYPSFVTPACRESF
jgi:hypothetical protein